MRKKRKEDIVTFFKEFKAYCNTFAPGKPMMLATNSFDIPNGMDTYPDLLKHLDILCPFGFARMPKEDLKGLEAANLLQKYVMKRKLIYGLIWRLFYSTRIIHYILGL